MKIVNTTRNTILADNIQIADNMFSRCKGLLGQKFLEKGSALIIRPCNSIHMFFMRFSIDVIFLDKHSKVVGLVKNIRPFRLSPLFFYACQAIELPAGTIDVSSTELTDTISFQS